MTCRKLGEEAARRGDREAGLTYAKRAMEITDPGAESSKGRPADLQRFLTPRGFAAMGLVYAGLAGNRRGTAAREDARWARQWLEKSLNEWRLLRAHPSFAPPHRREMRQVETALAGLTER